jgi:phosphoglycerate dehydrogenase-like enzyme
MTKGRDAYARASIAPLVIATNLDEVQNARLAQHRIRPHVIPYSNDRPAWQVPVEADLLFTFYRGWASAPAQPPSGWPHRLRWIQVAAAGVDVFPAWFFSGPVVTCGRGVAADSIAEYVLAAMLGHEKRFFDGVRVVDAASWKTRMLGRLSGKTLGLLGCGAIGSAVAKLSMAFGMDILAVTRGELHMPGITSVKSPADLVARSDHLVVALPLTRETRGIVDADLLRNAKPGLHIVNVSRGALVDQNALLDALDSGRIGAATLDVTTPEPLPADHPFYRHPRVRLTPHIAGNTDDSADRLTAKLFDNLDRFLAGEKLLDIVDTEHGY